MATLEQEPNRDDDDSDTRHLRFVLCSRIATTKVLNDKFKGLLFWKLNAEGFVDRLAGLGSSTTVKLYGLTNGHQRKCTAFGRSS